MTSYHPESYQILQIMTIMNQLRQTAIGAHDEICPPGMTISQLICISFLSIHQGTDLYQKDIESCFKLRRSTVSSLLNTLERKELIQRVSVAHDARLKKLVLTEKGQEIGQHVQQVLSNLNRQMVSNLDPGERETLSYLLRKIESGLTERCQ